MRCKHCGAEIIRIHTIGGPAICWASPTTYWPVRDNEARELLTPNGCSIYGNLTGELRDAVGIGYFPHTCRQMLLILQGRDSWDCHVYKGPDGNLYADVDPRKGWAPNICTKYQNDFDGEPDTPVNGVDFIFTPYRDAWYEQRNVDKMFYRLIEDNALRPVVFHSLRHSSTSLKLKLSRGNIKAVQGDTGHAEARMVTDTYAHGFDADRKLIAQEMDSGFFSKVGVDHKPAEADSATVDLLKQLVRQHPELLTKLLKEANGEGK